LSGDSSAKRASTAGASSGTSRWFTIAWNPQRLLVQQLDCRPRSPLLEDSFPLLWDECNVRQFFSFGHRAALFFGLGVVNRWAANTGRYEGATAEMAAPFPRLAAPPIRLPPSPAINGKVVMNTAATRWLALGDRVVWIDKDDHQPTGLGTTTRIAAHEVEVRWDAKPRSLSSRAPA
jgi:hypothetical protein